MISATVLIVASWLIVVGSRVMIADFVSWASRLFISDMCNVEAAVGSTTHTYLGPAIWSLR